MKRQRKHNIWNKEVKVADNIKIYYCVPVNLTALGLFRTQERDITMIATITDHNTMYCPRAVHIAVTEMGWTLKKLHKLKGKQHFKIAALY